jgi:1-acyl-sn-glycerol-3-phosphate acyltransferase
MRDRTWYSGDAGPASVVARIAALASDVGEMRRGFRWREPRPAGWPAAETAVPYRPSNLGWARTEPVRWLRYLVQRGLMMPSNQAVTRPRVEGREFVDRLERPVILASNHVSHADTPLLLGALSDRARERTVVAAAADYFYRRPWLGRVMSFYLNTFPFARSGGAQEVLHNSGELLRSGWNLLVYPEGTRSTDGRLQPFKPGVGHLATENHASVVPMHVAGTDRVLPKGRRVPIPAPVRIRIGKPLAPSRNEGARAFTERVESAVRSLAEGSQDPTVTGSWIERWRLTTPARHRSSGGREIARGLS